MKTNSTQAWQIASFTIDFVILLLLTLDNPMAYEFYEKHLTIITRIPLRVQYLPGLFWMLGSAFFTIISILIFKMKFYKKAERKSRLLKMGGLLFISWASYTGHFIFDNPPVVDLLVLLSFNVSFLLALGQFAKLFRIDLKSNDEDITNKMSLIKANTSIIENDHSFNFKTSQGYVNLVNPFRGIFVVGTAGAGKTYTLIESIIDQAFRKSYTAFIYDFKFPGLAEYTWNSYQINYEKAKLKKPKFFVLYFKDIRYSHRCNPLHPSILIEKPFALQATKNILFNINPEWAKKQGEFFSSSAMAICQATMWFLRLEAVRSNKNLSTLPHVIEFVSFPNSNMLVDVLLDEQDVQTIMTPIKDAINKGANEQLAGQLGSLQIGLSSIVDNKLYYVMSGHDFSLDLNNPDDPKILVLGNDDALKQAYAPALSLYASTVANTINQKGRRHCLYAVDEYPTMYIMNIENLPNTGRSNKICTLLGLQNFYQSEQVYGKEASQVINASFANIMMGQTNDEKTAQFAQNVLGQYTHTKKDMSIQFESDGGSHSFREEKRKVVEVNDMMELDAGVFVGKVADAGEGKEKKFFAKFETVKQPHLQKLPKMNEELADKTDEEIEAILYNNTATIKREVYQLIASKYFSSKIYLRLTNNQQVNDFLNKKVLQFYYENRQFTDLEIEEMGQFEKTKKEIFKVITEQIVKECVSFYQMTEARGGKAISGKLTVEEYTIRWQLEPVRTIEDGSVEENPNAPVTLIAKYFDALKLESKQTEIPVLKEETSIDQSDLNTDTAQEEEQSDKDDDIELFNSYLLELNKATRQDLELHDSIESFIMTYEEDLGQINEYCQSVSQGASENIYEYIYDFVSFNGVQNLLAIHKELRDLHSHISDKAFQDAVLLLVTNPDESELENANPDMIPNILQLGTTALNGISRKLQLVAST